MYEDDEPTNRPKPWVQMFGVAFAFVFVVTVSCSVGLPLTSWLSRMLSTDLQRSQQSIREAEWHKNVLLLQDVGAGMLVALTVGSALLVLTFVGVKVRRNARLVYARNGVFPIERRRVGDGLLDRLRRGYCRVRGLPYSPIREIVIDHNLAPAHLRSYLLTEDGVAFQMSPDWLDERHRLAAVQGARQANNAQALMSGTTPLHRPTAGAMRAMLDQRPPKPTGYDTDSVGDRDLPALPMMKPSLSTALAENRNPDELLLAYDESGHPVFWNVQFDPGFSLTGAQRQGKTMIAVVVILSAVKKAYHVIIFDPEGGKDFGPYEHICEWHPTTPQLLVPQVRALLPEFERRHRLLDEHSVGDFRHLPADARPQRILLVFEEFKKMRASQNGAMLAEFDRVMSELVTRGAKAGIYILVLAQDKGREQGGWPETLDVNLTGKATVRQGKKGYGNVGYFNAHKLLPRQVGYQDQVFTAYEVAGRWLAEELPRLRGDGVRLISDVSVSPSYPLAPAPSEAGADGDESGLWDDVVDRWFAAHPDTLTGDPRGINDLARTIAQADGYARDPDHPQGWPFGWRDKQSVAHAYYHKRRAMYAAGEWEPGAGRDMGLDTMPDMHTDVDFSQADIQDLQDMLAENGLDTDMGREVWAELRRRKAVNMPKPKGDEL